MPRWIQMFHEGSANDRDRLGGKGANLAEMTNLALPVPPGFTITTEACRAYHSDGTVPVGLWQEIEDAISVLEAETGRGFGNAENPLLVSVRSGAKISMPGMMDTILNIGLNEQTINGLARLYDERLALDCARRLHQMFGTVVLELDSAPYDEITRSFDGNVGLPPTVEELRQAIEAFKTIAARFEVEVPEDPAEQLRQAVLAVFDSWNTPRAIAYRRSEAIPEDLGTAVNIQTMVFGNVGDDSATGVAFTRDPNSGKPGLFGEVLVNAQGEDVVAGIRTPKPVSSMAESTLLRPAYEELLTIAEDLEAHFRDMQDIEFTVERGKLWVLQARTAKRTAKASFAIAQDLVAEGMIDRGTAVQRIQPVELERQLHPQIDESDPLPVIATGLAASPGAASGKAIFDPAEALSLGESGEDVILVRQETSADDFPAMEKSRGILTARGGMTSHAAVVARGIGKPAVTGCAELEINSVQFKVGNVVVKVGDDISIDGSTGRVFVGKAKTVAPGLDVAAERLLSWADEFRRLGVRANADTPADAQRACDFGAEGIGLCRTEHMFFGEDRIDLVREMILAENDQDRECALSQLERMQTEDFVGIFRAMDGFPVTIRTLDPPLHEFLPREAEDIQSFAERRGLSTETVHARIEALREANPMLGHRGVRLGITFPEITEMQARAIFGAALMVAAEGLTVLPEVMIPFVSDAEELRRQREVVVAQAEILFAGNARRVPIRIGTMIEVPRAALLADRIAEHADFISFGTNDLTQTTFGLSRDDSARFLPAYVEQGILLADPFQALDRSGVGRLIEIGIQLGRQTRPDLTVGLCGEHGGEPSTVAFCHDLGIDYVSCSPYRVPVARLSAAHAALAAAGEIQPVKENGKVDKLVWEELAPIPIQVGGASELGFLD